ncbi:MAG TPA: murein biosynthesis integral membrane protein MurJ [Candidatus Limnocylindrales bacterium]|nr:murein biosynthesis integral membrane protein MurJ [Candidatus Limnocylindrales bacterium]
MTVALARAGIIVAGAFLVSRILGWLRMTVITGVFGVTSDVDAFFAAFRIPDLIFQLVAAGAIASALVPVVSALLAGEAQARAWKVVSTVLNLTLVASVGLSILFWITAPALVPLITPGFDEATTALTVDLSRLMILGPIFLALGAVVTALLNASGRFAAAALAPIAYNLGIIVAALLLGPSLGVTALAVGVVAGSAGHLLVQLPAVRRRTTFAYEPRIQRDDPDARKVFALLVPRAIGMGAAQITFIVNTTLASTLVAGSITAYYVAFTILQLPIGFLAVPLGIVLLPTLSRTAAGGDARELARMVSAALRPLAYAMMFVTATAIVTRVQIVTLLFDYGRFDQAAIDLTSSVLLVFLLGLAAHGAIAILARAFYASQDTKTPVAAAIVSVAVNVVVSVATIVPLGLIGLALGIAIGSWVEVAILLWRLAAVNPSFGARAQLRAWGGFAALALAAAVPAALALMAVGVLLGPDLGKVAALLEAVVATAVALIVYAGLSKVLHITELDQVVRIAVRSVRGERARS